MLDDNGRWICVQNFKSISSKIAELRYKTCKKQSLFTSFRDFTVIFRFFYLLILTFQKRVLRPFFAFFEKILPKNMYRSPTSRIFWFYLFCLVTWDDLDLYCGHKAQEMTLTIVGDTFHAVSLFKRHSIALFVNYPYKVRNLNWRSLMTSQVRSK